MNNMQITAQLPTQKVQSTPHNRMNVKLFPLRPLVRLFFKSTMFYNESDMSKGKN